MILACQKLLGQITKVLGFGETPPPRMGKTPKKSRIFFLTGSLILVLKLMKLDWCWPRLTDMERIFKRPNLCVFWSFFLHQNILFEMMSSLSLVLSVGRLEEQTCLGIAPRSCNLPFVPRQPEQQRKQCCKLYFIVAAINQAAICPEQGISCSTKSKSKSRLNPTCIAKATFAARCNKQYLFSNLVSSDVFHTKNIFQL